MSTSSITCRDCGHTLAKRHHTGRIKIAIGIHVTVLANGRVQIECPCGNRMLLYTERGTKAA